MAINANTVAGFSVDDEGLPASTRQTALSVTGVSIEQVHLPAASFVTGCYAYELEGVPPGGAVVTLIGAYQVLGQAGPFTVTAPTISAYAIEME